MKKRILIIDDEKPIGDLIAEFCEILGYETKTLEDGKQALEAVKAFHPDLVTLDLCMPEVPGVRVLTLLKKDADTRDIPVIVISSLIGTQSLETQDSALQLSQGTLPKPLHMQTLKEKLSVILEASENAPQQPH